LTPDGCGPGRANKELRSTELGRKRSPEGQSSVILVADDDDLFRKLITLLMRQDGHFVLSAANGHEALELSRRFAGSIDLLITDVEMPRLNGADLCAHLLGERPGTQVLVISGAGNVNELVNPAFDVPFLAKPFDPKTLKTKVRTILTAAS